MDDLISLERFWNWPVPLGLCEFESQQLGDQDSPAEEFEHRVNHKHYDVRMLKEFKVFLLRLQAIANLRMPRLSFGRKEAQISC